MTRIPTIGIVREGYSKWERRAPLTPTQVSSLLKTKQTQILIQPSSRRVFTDEEYRAAGAIVTNDLSPAHLIIGVKQIKPSDVQPHKTYMFFSHTIKAQPANMPLLDAFLVQRARLVDYECVRSGTTNERLIAFGDFAGRAGMILALRGLGSRLLDLGFSNPFLNVSSAYTYPSLADAEAAVAKAGQTFKQTGGANTFLPRTKEGKVHPLTVVFTGDGKVSRGAQELFQALKPQMLTSVADFEHDLDPQQIYGLVVKEKDVAKRITDGGFDKTQYHTHPHLFDVANEFCSRVLPHATCVLTGAYWDAKYPRWMPNAVMHANHSKLRNLLVVADAACDVSGSCEFLHRTTSIEEPFFYVDTARANLPEVRPDDNARLADMDVKLVAGVDILPSELPREATHHFGECLSPFLLDLVKDSASLSSMNGADYKTALPIELSRAVIACDGKLQASYGYISEIRAQRDVRQQTIQLTTSMQDGVRGSTRWYQLEGHLFDSKLINRTLDLIENLGGKFKIERAFPSEPRGGRVTRAHTTVLLAVESPTMGQTNVQEMEARLFSLIKEAPQESEASIDVLTPAQVQTIRRRMIDENKETAAYSNGGSAAGELPTTTTALTDDTIPTRATTHRRLCVVFGCGAVAVPAIRRLTQSFDVIVVGAVQGELDEMRRKVPAVMATVRGNVSANGETMKISIPDSRPYVALSLLPVHLHNAVLKSCLESNGKASGMVTASYRNNIAPDLEQQAKDVGFPILMEMGLDPGIDHMSVMEAIENGKKLGKTVTHFESVCGGLPAPECADNVFGYKLTWSPRGFLLALNSSAKWLQDGLIREVKGGPYNLLNEAKPYALTKYPALALEHLPNRDSLAYVQIYGLDPTRVKTCYRGTLRYRGFSQHMMLWEQAGFLNDDAALVSSEVKNLKELLDKDAQFQTSALKTEMDWDLIQNVNFTQPVKSKLDALSRLFATKMTVDANVDRDLVLMQHKLKFIDENGVESGESHAMVLPGNKGETAMAKTVGLTAALGVELVGMDDFRFNGGIILPTDQRVWQYCLKELRGEGIFMVKGLL